MDRQHFGRSVLDPGRRSQPAVPRQCQRPAGHDTLGLSFTAFWKDKEGYIDNVAIPLGGWDDYEYYGGSGSLRWAATERLEITVQGLYQNSQQDGFATIQVNHADDLRSCPAWAPANPGSASTKPARRTSTRVNTRPASSA
jgi:hypothetical protein